MEQHERDYFVSRIRSGNYFLHHKGFRLKVVEPTLEELHESNEVYVKSMTASLNDGIKTQDQTLEWMREIEFWTDDDDKKEEGLGKDIETLKVEIFNHRNQEAAREKIRKYLRAAEDQLSKVSLKKLKYHDVTCEGIAFLEKNLFIISRCTFIGDSLYDFSGDLQHKDVWMSYRGLLCTEKIIRELARTEPWRSSWVLRESSGIPLFAANGRELSMDQKNIVAWSSMYDNIQEAAETPAEDVVNDDDMLDGWFIVQKRKREAERTKSELEGTIGDRVKNSDEIFMMAGSKRDAERIDSMNSLAGKMIKKEREAHIKHSGGLEQHHLPDQKMQIQNQLNQQYKDKFRR